MSEGLQQIDDHTHVQKPDKTGRWVVVSEENILVYDMPGRSGLDKAVLLRAMDEAHRESKLIHMWIED